MFKLIIGIHLILIGLVLTTAMTAQAAEPQCTLPSSTPECESRIAQDRKTSKQFQAPQMPTFFEIARNRDGSVKYMKQARAIQYCSSQGAHLPSARELVQLATSLGARGIVASCGSDNFCYDVNVTNADGSYDSFKFSYAGYQRPSANDVISVGFWSSSVGSPGSFNGIVFYSDEGYFDHVSRRGSYEAVRCVSGR